MKTAVLTDSTAYIPKDWLDKYDIHTVPLSVTFGNETYREEIDISTEAFYNKLRTDQHFPKTSQPSIGVLVEKYEELAANYDACITVCLSSGISGTYQSAISAGDMTEGLDVYVFDSEISCMPQGFYVLESARLAHEGADPSDIMKRLETMKHNMKAFFMVDDLSNLQRGGRLSSAQAVIGSLLQVKPILYFKDKVIVPFEKIRTQKKALARIIGMLENDAEKGIVEKVSFIHANHPEAVQALEKAFKEKYPDIETNISYFGPVIGTHLGEGALGVGWYTTTD